MFIDIYLLFLRLHIIKNLKHRIIFHMYYYTALYYYTDVYYYTAVYYYAGVYHYRMNELSV